MSRRLLRGVRDEAVSVLVSFVLIRHRPSPAQRVDLRVGQGAPDEHIRASGYLLSGLTDDECSRQGRGDCLSFCLTTALPRHGSPWTSPDGPDASGRLCDRKNFS